MTLSDFLSQVSIVEVFEHLGGTVRNNRGVAFWNPKANGESVQLFPKSNTWKYYSQDQGGGVLDLIQTAHECNKHEALKWIEQTYGPLNQQARAPREFISAAEIHTAELWLVGYRHALETRKAKLSAALLKCMERGEDPGPSLAAELKAVTEAIAVTQDLRQPRQVVEAYRRHLSVKPALTEKIVQDEAKWQNTIARAMGV